MADSCNFRLLAQNALCSYKPGFGTAAVRGATQNFRNILRPGSTVADMMAEVPE